MATARSIVTEEEFLSLPESMDRVELLDGEVVVARSPSFWHQELLGRLAFALRSWARSRPEPVCIGQSPMDVSFGPGRILQPDIFVLFGAVTAEQEGPIRQVPELCVEVLSTNRAYDRVTKRMVYAAAGVREYWVVEQAGPIERWHGDDLALRDELTDRLTSPLLPGFDLDLGELYHR